MRIIFLGTPEFAIPSLEALIQEKDIEIPLVISQVDKRRSRNKFEPTPVKKYALEAGLLVETPEKINRKEWIDRLQDLKADFLIVVAYGQIIGKRLLNAFPDRIVNIHGSILPKYRGAAPIQRSLLDGLDETGVTAMLIDEGMDTGDMLGIRKLPIVASDDLNSLSEKLAKEGADLLMDTLKNFPAHYAKRIKQNDQEATYAQKIEKSDGYLNFEGPGRKIFDQVRCLKDWPGAKFMVDGQIYKVHQVKLEDFVKDKKPRQIVFADAKGIGINSKDKLVVISIIQAMNRKKMEVEAFLRGNDFPIDKKVEMVRD